MLISRLAFNPTCNIQFIWSYIESTLINGCYAIYVKSTVHTRGETIQVKGSRPYCIFHLSVLQYIAIRAEVTIHS